MHRPIRRMGCNTAPHGSSSTHAWVLEGDKKKKRIQGANARSVVPLNLGCRWSTSEN